MFASCADIASIVLLQRLVGPVAIVPGILTYWALEWDKLLLKQFYGYRSGLLVLALVYRAQCYHALLGCPDAPSGRNDSHTIARFLAVIIDKMLLHYLYSTPILCLSQVCATMLAAMFIMFASPMEALTLVFNILYACRSDNKQVLEPVLWLLGARAETHINIFNVTGLYFTILLSTISREPAVEMHLGSTPCAALRESYLLGMHNVALRRDSGGTTNAYVFHNYICLISQLSFVYSVMETVQ